MKKTLIVALMMVAGIAQAQQDQPKENWECLSKFDQKILGCDSSASCKEEQPKIEACIVHLEEINQFCKTAQPAGVCYNGGRYRQSQLVKLRDRLVKYPEYITYYEGVEAEKAAKDAVLAERRRIENEKYEAERKIEEAKEKAAAKKAANAQAAWAAKEKQRLATCNPGDPYVGMSESSLRNLCKQAHWTNTDDYGSVVYRWYKTGYARVMVKNGVVAAISY